MAVYATGARQVTDEMVIEAARAVASQVTPQQLTLGMLFPPQSAMLETGIQAAAQVADLVFDAGLARVDRPDDIQAFIRQHVYQPQYTPFA
jgi:malate dehydrogenase (oxaloacetate-decarboxylating)(NADP+)